MAEVKKGIDVFAKAIETLYVLRQDCRSFLETKIKSKAGNIVLPFEYRLPITKEIEVLYPFNNFDEIRKGKLTEIHLKIPPAVKVRYSDVRSELLTGNKAIFVLAQVAQNRELLNWFESEVERFKEEVSKILTAASSLLKEMNDKSQEILAAEELNT